MMRRSIFLLLLFLLVAPTGIAFTESQGDSARLYKEIEKTLYPDNVTYISEMVIHRPKKIIHKKIKVYLKGHDKSLVEFLDPPLERGTRILMIDKNMWMFLPSVEKVIRVNGTMNAGGDFFYDDILRVKYSVDYDTISVTNGDPYSVLSLQAKTDSAPYPAIKIAFHPNGRMPVRSEFYVEDGMLLKSLTYSKPKSFAGKRIPSQFLMQLASSEDYKTTMTIVDFNTFEIPDRVFTQAFLKKGL